MRGRPPSGELYFAVFTAGRSFFLFSFANKAAVFGWFAAARPTTTTISRMPMGMSRYCVFTLKHSGMPKRIRPMMSEARAVPMALPLPPVESVPPSTHAVMIFMVSVPAKVAFRGAQI